MSNPAAGRLAVMRDGETVPLRAGGITYQVTYHAEQALGDDNRPAHGYTTGTYELVGPDQRVRSFRHSPYKPNSWAGRAKPYAAEQVIAAILEVSA